MVNLVADNFLPSLERVLRLLITQGWFREPRQGYFANNRMSNIIQNDQPGFHLASYMYVAVSLGAAVKILIFLVGTVCLARFPIATPQ